ncbi:efflux RND transporter permease subunit [Paraburkholderia sp. MMS20-SJTR3]|uniref:Efflux RND transporter permease subunit n=1 Tax=Paraburkholderia sejongensis TaxID=2886946 RepID=A0ABS8K3W1_9BURK|nr:efflux RND transporter permease subunit [Paraburkholderia sp. MMS20-SJTR3]MCC8396847.1 efflux RND transporter permease subunit [Paraburkholderia sp. MMS20-SJTR3]
MIGPNLSEWSLSKRPLVVFLMLAALLAGTLSFFRLGRAEDPVFTFRTMVVSAAWPGATVDDTLSQVTERLERTLQETRHLDRVRSYTTAGQTTIFVDLLQSTPPSEVQDIWYQVRKNVSDMQRTLPAGTVGPFFNDDFGDTYGIIYGFTSDGFSMRELRDRVEAIRSRLLQVPDVSKIEVLGAQDEQIFIEFSTSRLAGLRLDYSAIVGALRAQNVIMPTGVLQTGQERVFFRITGAFDSERDIENVNLVLGGRIVRLGDIATVRRGVVDPPQPMFRVNGKAAIGLAIAMRDSGDILALGHNLKAAMDEASASLPVGIEPFLVANQADTVDVAISDFMASLWQAIIIILVCSFVSLGIRPGTVVALSIPLTLAIVFAIMDIVHIDLHRVSLGALIIALTLLVDDAMTTVDAMINRLAAGDTKDQAATFAYRTLAAPMLLGTLVSISSFVPIGFAKSSAGEYTFSIFAVVAIALLVSWFGAVIFSPLVGQAILKAPKPRTPSPKPGKMVRAYGDFLRGALRLKWITIAVTLLAFVLSIFLVRFVPRQFFPASDRPELTVDLTLRQNASIHATEAQVKKIEALLKSDPDVDHFSSYLGRGAIRFILTLNVQLPNPFFSQIVVVAKDLPARDRLQLRLEKILAEQFPDIVSRVSPLELGPPVGWPLQYRVSGPDPAQVRKIALDLAALVGADERTRHVNFDWMEPARQIRIHINQDEARQLGVSTGALAGIMNTIITGTPITQVRDDIYLVNVVARASDERPLTLQTLSTLQVPTPSGRMLALSQFATFTEEQEAPLIWRRNRVPTLTVRADMMHGVLPDVVVASLAPKLAEFNAGLPKGYHVATGGISEESAISQASVFAVVPLMIVLMLASMMVLLVSFKRLAMVVSVMPLGLIGVVLALLVFNRPLGFVAILGILALIGMIAKNGLILIVQIETYRNEGMGVLEAVVASGTSRIRPMFLTSISTVLGLIPIAPTVFWGAMAFAIMGGLLVATLLTLVFLPALYMAVFGGEDRKASQSSGPARGTT